MRLYLNNPYNQVYSHKSEYFIRIILINGVLSESIMLIADAYLFILKQLFNSSAKLLQTWYVLWNNEQLMYESIFENSLQIYLSMALFSINRDISQIRYIVQSVRSRLKALILTSTQYFTYAVSIHRRKQTLINLNDSLYLFHNRL